MYRRLTIGFGVLIMALVGVIALMVLRERRVDLKIQGKPLSHWLEGYRMGGSLEGRARTDAIIDEAGTNALPSLLRLLRQHDSSLKRTAINLTRRQPFLRQKFVRAQERHYQAGVAFSHLGPAAKDAIPALMKIYDENISGSSRYWTLYALGAIGPVASNALPFLVSALSDTNSEVKVSCIAAIEAVHADPTLSVAALTSALNDQQFIVKYSAILALGRMGNHATSAVPELTKLLQGPDPKLRQIASGALSNIQSNRLENK